MQRFTIPRDIYIGENALDHLKELTGTKAVIVIGSQRLVKDGTINKIQSLLNEGNINSTVFSGVESDPSVATVKRGVELFNSLTPDLVIGVGGGSAIDAAKAMWIFYEAPTLTFEEAAKPFNLPTLRQKAKFVAISTTSGTGSEVTNLSVITDNETGIKYPIADYNITPDVAIVDTNLVKSLTPKLVADTGMDALTHAIEAYVSTISNEITDALAMKSIEITTEEIVKSFNGNLESRERMHVSQCLAGMSFANAILGIVHSMSHKSSRSFEISHGRANAIYLPYVIAFNSKDYKAKAKYADIARRLGLVGNTDNSLVQSLINAIKELRIQMKMPESLSEYGVKEEYFNEHLDSIAKTSIDDPCTSTNPRKISYEEMKSLFEACYYGLEVDF